uniref:Uncharacterized protein n=1 Tax=Caudovirales sp. ctkvU4 TaxID=2826783 RepID=A0A8S5QR25_9CAUD|nr:MAG TPA: hypothetical protein [Caudovirales sp. ctkvU4]
MAFSFSIPIPLSPLSAVVKLCYNLLKERSDFYVAL